VAGAGLDVLEEAMEEELALGEVVVEVRHFQGEGVVHADAEVLEAVAAAVDHATSAVVAQSTSHPHQMTPLLVAVAVG
jgi:hypothetical protein